MTFFARPNLDSDQFKQLTGTTLTLSGQTRIATTTGLALSNGSGSTIVINAKGSNVVGNVMTFDGSEIRLMPSQGGSGGTSMYNPPYKTPASITLGGIPNGTTLTGRTLSSIIEQLLVPTLNPTTGGTGIGYTITPSTLYYEIGCTATITGNISFNQGFITPYYGIPPAASCARSGLPFIHKYIDFNGGVNNMPCTNLTGSLPGMTRILQPGVNTTSASVCYVASTKSVYNSAGVVIGSPLPSGITTSVSQIICGVTPWYYGKKVNNTITKTDVAAGTKGPLTTLASSTLPITYNSSPSDYLWFAVPVGTPAKTAWFVCASNQGVIGGVNNLFASSCLVTGVTLTYGCVCPYNVYVTCITTGTAPGVPMCML
jgi:hypothetical protein